MTHKLSAVPLHDIEPLWPYVVAFIKKALDRDGSGRFLPEDVLHLLLAQRAALWIAWRDGQVDAAIVTEIIHYPRCKDCRIWLVGGRNMRGWVALARDTIEAFAKFNGCTYVSGGFRKGWLRIGIGWREAGVNIEKRLD